MAELTCNIPELGTPRALEQAIAEFKNSDLTGQELFCLWQAIRNGALQQMTPELEGDRISGEESY